MPLSGKSVYKTSWKRKESFCICASNWLILCVMMNAATSTYCINIAVVKLSRMRKRIIIFDDDKDILAICSMILSGMDYDVITRESCTDILEQLDAHRPQAIVIDNKLPGLSGADGVRLVKGSVEYRHIPVIFFTGSNNAEALAQQAGADFVLPKPVDLSQLEEIVGQAMAQ